MRIATLDDVAEVKSMAVEFLAASGYEKFGNEHVIEELIVNIITSDPTHQIILLKPGIGFIAGIKTPFIFGNDMLASEIAWWINPDQRKSGEGLDLLKAFEYWAKNVSNCKLISMTSLNKDVEKVYKKLGYKLYERAYMKVF